MQEADLAGVEGVGRKWLNSLSEVVTSNIMLKVNKHRWGLHSWRRGREVCHNLLDKIQFPIYENEVAKHLLLQGDKWEKLKFSDRKG